MTTTENNAQTNTDKQYIHLCISEKIIALLNSIEPNEETQLLSFHYQLLELYGFLGELVGYCDTNSPENYEMLSVLQGILVSFHPIHHRVGKQQIIKSCLKNIEERSEMKGMEYRAFILQGWVASTRLMFEETGYDEVIFLTKVFSAFMPS